MKKSLIIIVAIILSNILLEAQNSFRYQAVFRDSNDKPYTNTNIDLRFTILYGSSSGIVVFSEKHSVVSSQVGIVVANVGEGTNISGNIANIDWSQGKYYLKVDADINITGNYEYFGTNIISRVPTAVYADNCGNVDDADHDPYNEIQSLSFDSNSNQLSISNGNSVTIPTGGTDADADPNNEIQVLSKTGNTVSLSKNGGSFVDAVDDADADSGNEIQVLSKTGNIVSLSKNGGTFIDAVKDEDSDSTNEIQQLHYDYYKHLLWIDGVQDSIFNIADAAWNMYIVSFPPAKDDTFFTANYPVGINYLWSDTLLINHINSKGGDIFLDDNFPGTPALHLYNNNIHFDSIEGEFIIEPHHIWSQNTSLNKGFYLDDDRLNFNELDGFSGVLFRPIEINRNFGITMASAAGFKTVDINNKTGDISLFRENGQLKIGLNEYLGSGDITTYNSSEKPICYLTNVGINHDHGYIAVGNQNGSIKAGMYVDNNDKGHIFADVKNFIMTDPGNEENMIMYASLEGPEAAAYDRGRGVLENGGAFISFKDHFKKVINTENATIQLTPMSADSKGLAVTKITKDGFWVQELYNGKGDYRFFWEAKGVRKGYEDYKVNVSKSSLRLSEPIEK